MRVYIDGEIDPQIVSFSVSEDSTPLFPDDSTGGTTSFTLETTHSNPRGFGGKSIVIDDDVFGQIIGVISTVDGGDSGGTITADTVMTRLSLIRSAQPKQGTLQAVLTYYFGLVGLQGSNLVFEAGLPTGNLVFPGWRAVVWDQIKKVSSALGTFDIVLLDGQIHIRPVRLGTVTPGNSVSAMSESFTVTELAEKFEVYNYHSSWGTKLVYPCQPYDDEAGGTPAPGWTSEAEVITVGAGEIYEGTVDINASLVSVSQPVAVKEVLRSDAGSQYTVMGKDGVETLDPSVWTARGGWVKVTIGEDTRTLKIQVYAGTNDPELAPFRIAMTGASDYSSLRITGTGVHFAKTKHVFDTGIPADEAVSELGTSVDNEFISGQDLLYRAALRMSNRYSGLIKSLAGSAGVLTDGGSQLFGRVNGFRLRVNNTFYRIRTLGYGPGSVDFTSEQDTLFSDWKNTWAGRTFQDFKNESAGRTFRDHAESPLWRA